MKKTFLYAWKVFVLSWKANGVFTLVSLISEVYEKSIYPLIQVLLLSYLLDMISHPPVFYPSLGNIIIIYISVSLLRLALKSYIDVKQPYFDFVFSSYLDNLIIEKLAVLDPAKFEQAEFQNLLAQLGPSKDAVLRHIFRILDLLASFVTFVTAAFIVSTIFPLFAPFLLLASVPSYIAWDRLRKISWPYFTDKLSFLMRVTSYIKDLLSADSTSKEVTVFTLGNTLQEKILGIQKKYYRDFNRTISPRFFEIAGARVIQFGIFLYTQYINLQAVLVGKLGIGQFTLFFQQSYNLAVGAEQVLNQYSSISMRTKNLDQLFDFLSSKRVITSTTSPLSVPSDPNPPVIEFKNVTFLYPKTKRPILKDFNLLITSGEKLALVGENGAGKTTIIKLLLRFYDVTTGEILINGVNIKDIDLSEWHKMIGALFQDFIKYQFTFKENVYFGRVFETPNPEMLEAAIKQSGADQYLDNLPKKLDQTVGKMFDGGIDLSGGQWQKLALARAFYRNAPFLILDEPTAAIDAKAEYEIFERVQNLQKDKTVIIISHRFSTVRNADRIVVLDEGRIVEEGNHEILMKKKGLYAELFTLQAKGYQ